MNNLKKQWHQLGDRLYQTIIPDQSKLEPYIYILDFDKDKYCFYLRKNKEKFTFPYKLYETETEFINRVVNTHKHITGNIGILLNGIKGTGKTVTAELICNALNLPVVIVSKRFEEELGLSDYLSGFEEEIIVFFDEYEKIYDIYDDDILTIMDGVLNTNHRKIFLLTTNNPNINNNLISRPSRIRYIKHFKDLKLETIIEIIDDLLIYKEFKQDIIQYISGLEIITIDIVKNVIFETNIHNQPPSKYKDVFNVTTKSDTYNIYNIDGIPTLMFEKVRLNIKEFNEKVKGVDLRINDRTFGTITDIITHNEAVIDIYEKEIIEEVEEITSDKKTKNKTKSKTKHKVNSALLPTPKHRKLSEILDNKLEEENNSLIVKIRIEGNYSKHSTFYSYVF